MSSFKGAQSWWGGRLACLADSLATYVIALAHDMVAAIILHPALISSTGL
jgi:hypothetical protein